MIVYAIAYVIRLMLGFAKTVNHHNTNRKRATGIIEACPACNRNIQVSGDEMICPHCETKLGRNNEGKLLIKVN